MWPDYCREVKVMSSVNEVTHVSSLYLKTYLTLFIFPCMFKINFQHHYKYCKIRQKIRFYGGGGGCNNKNIIWRVAAI